MRTTSKVASTQLDEQFSLTNGALISSGATGVALVLPAKRCGRVDQANMFWAGVGLAGAAWIGLPLLDSSPFD